MPGTEIDMIGVINDTILKILGDAKKSLKDCGVISYECDAELLLCHVLGTRRIDLYAGGLDITDSQAEAFKKLIQRRAKAEPLQYITGKAEFYGLSFCVEPGVFIPRPETEILVESILNIFSRPLTLDPGPCILDLCTGSGNIAICLAKHAKYGKIIAVDISQNAVETAKKNAVFNGVADKIEFRKADLFKGLVEGFDIITCNPPYIKGEDLEILPAEVKRDPQAALDGGEDGLDFYRRIISEAPDFLKDNGFLALETGDGQAQAVEAIIKANGISGFTEIIKDLNGIDRVLTWTKS